MQLVRIGSAGSLPRLAPHASTACKPLCLLLAVRPQVVEALLELACLPPDTSLHGGRVAISISSECTHGGSQPGGGSIMLRERPRLSSISVVSSMGWHFELRPQPFADVSKYDGLVELLLVRGSRTCTAH